MEAPGPGQIEQEQPSHPWKSLNQGQGQSQTIRPHMKQIKSKWPKLFPKPDLQVHELLHGQIYTIPDFFTVKECDNLITHIQNDIPLEKTSGIPKRGEALRSNDRVSVRDPAFADLLWTLGINTVCTSTPAIYKAASPNVPVGLNSNIRIYRYTPGQRFECHYDDTVRDDRTNFWTEWTLLIYLTGEEEVSGGETVFYKTEKKKSSVVVAPSKGTALLHRHGASCLLHEGKEVTKGVKYVLRSDVLVN